MNYESITVGQVIIVVGAVVAFVKFVDWMWARFVAPHLKKEADFSAVTAKLDSIDKKLTNDFVKLEQHDRRLEGLEVRMTGQERDSEELHKSLRVLVVALQAMIKASLDNGNNREGLKHAEDELNHYLNSKL